MAVKLMRALDGIASATDAVAPDTRLNSDHPLVRANPELFVPDDTPDDEVVRRRGAIMAEALAAGRASRPVARQYTFRVLKRQTVYANGRTYTHGDEFTLEGEEGAEFAAHALGVGVELVRPRRLASA